MSNPKCPFCGTEWPKHEAGRCLNHWVEAIRKGYDHVARGHPHNLASKRKGFFYIEALVSPFCADEGLKEYVTKYSAHKYSTDMNHAMTLWQDDWILHNYMEGEVLVWAIWDKVVASRSMSDGSSRHIPIAEAKTPALAICRAFLIANLKGENDA